ncbi:hypothetical protein C5B97_03035 [Pseudoclavibacter sp. RFBB5]|nr:hypothetical protein C5B97_03035 [Pseudoclavibacter sp. RFBB5]
MVDLAAVRRHHAAHKAAPTVANGEPASHRTRRSVAVDLDKRPLDGVGEDALELGSRVDETANLRSRNGDVTVKKGRS